MYQMHHQGQPVSSATVFRSEFKKWKQVLKIRHLGQHSRCMTCPLHENRRGNNMHINMYTSTHTYLQTYLYIQTSIQYIYMSTYTWIYLYIQPTYVAKKHFFLPHVEPSIFFFLVDSFLTYHCPFLLLTSSFPCIVLFTMMNSFI